MHRKAAAFLVGLIAIIGLLSAVTDKAPSAESVEGPEEDLSSVGAAGISGASTNPALRVILGAGAKGNLKPGVKRYAPGTKVQYVFSPTAGHSAAMVVRDGKLVKPRGTITMSGDHYLWAFGNPKSGKKFDNVMTVPADVTKIPYPDFYRRAPSFSFNVADPYCAVTSDVISYPTSYLGAFPMPPVAGAPLSSEVLRGVFLRDYWDDGDNPAQNEGCTHGYREAFTESLKKLKRLGVDHVNNYQTGILNDINAAELRFVEEMRLNDADLTWIVAQVKAAGLEYHNYLAVMGDSKGRPLPSKPDPAWASRLMDAWTKFVIGRAVVAQRLGIEALALDWSAYGWEMTPELIAIYVPKMTVLAQRVRRVYSGKIMLGTAYLPSDPVLLKSLDWVHCPVGGWASEEENSRLDVALIKRNALIGIGACAATLGAAAPPVVWGMAASSHRNFFTQGWVEDSFCVPSPEDCSQRKIKTDFSVQALAFEAALEAIKEQNLLKTASVEVCGYWFTDVLRPKDSFPNLSLSIRNKPAESIVYEWFKR